jgi:integrase
MTKRRGFRDGGIDARGENSWRIRYRVNGRRFTKTVKGTKSAALKALRDLLHAGDTGEHVAPDKMTLAEWINHWIEIGAPGNKQRREVGQRSIERYAELLRCHVVSTLG